MTCHRLTILAAVRYTALPAVVLYALIGAGCQTLPARAPQQTIPEVVVIPTLGTDHQFNLDYTVAHVAATLDAIAPDAIVIADYTDWLRAKCIFQATAPEHHVALTYALDNNVPIWGTRTRPSQSAYDRSIEGARRLNERYASPDAVQRDYRRALEQTTARIAREFSFNAQPQSLRFLLQSGFKDRAASWTPAQRDGIQSFARQLTDSLAVLVASNPQRRRWAVLFWWGHAVGVAELIRAHPGMRYRAVEEFLGAAATTLEKQMDVRHVAWILSGMLDEWYGMWAPQVFPTERLASLLDELRKLAPNEAATRFLEARWLMQNRDYAAAESILARLVAEAGPARFPFPLNGKWIRPPWSSVQRKAKLNLAFVYDLRGSRDSALRLYADLLAAGDTLNSEARAAGYTYDDIRWVVESYTQLPYSGLPTEAFRHFRLIAARPQCAPSSSG